PSDMRSGSTNAQTTTFTHSYARAGAYTVRFVVSDNAGQEAKSSMTVQVGEKTTNGSLYLRPDALNLRVGETQGIAVYFQPVMPPCPVGMACAQVMPTSYRVDAQFTVENPAVIAFQYAIPMCIQSEIKDNYCGTQVIAEGKQIGVTKITATWNGFTATMPASVSQ
ncbi:MAG: PKD domain-containing protein, partial [Candidatus Ryanbacteria bacterium]|nr:PKD domain-containing protein [Candidatus Ryanbacteria bacterium]